MDPLSLTQGDIHSLRNAAEQAWGDDTRNPAYHGHPDLVHGQCYVTSRWLQSLLGGHVARKTGHYFWLSPDRQRALDLTGDQFGGSPMLYKPTTHPHFAGYETLPPEQVVDDARAIRLGERANAALEGRPVPRVAFGLSDAYPGETPEKIEEMDDRPIHDEPSFEPGNGEYKFVYGNGDLHISPDHSHDELAGHADVLPDHTGPLAVGHVILTMGRATFEVQSNISLRAMERVFKDYCKHVGWQWGGMADINGQPISDDFAPKKSYWYGYDRDTDHLVLSQKVDDVFEVVNSDDHAIGRVSIDGDYARISSRVARDVADVLQEWADDFSLTLVSGNDNVLKTIEDIDMKDLYTPNPTDGSGQFFNEKQDGTERTPGGVFLCPDCEQIFPNWNLYQVHRNSEHPAGDMTPADDPSSGSLQMPNHDDPYPAHFTEQDGTRIAVFPAGLKEARRVEGFARYAKAFDYDHENATHWVAYTRGCPVGYAVVVGTELRMVQTMLKRAGVADALLDRVERYHPMLVSGTSYPWQDAWLRKRGWVNFRDDVWMKTADKQPKDLLEAGVPFIYDIQEDKITTGKPGARHSDIIGRFTPGGIVEGIYEPGGKVIVRTITNTPYTVRHMLELWYYSNPGYEVKSVHLRDDAGHDTKLANQDIGSYIRTMTAADPAAQQAYKALRSAGGKVFAVGGAVRDALMGKDPKDIDLMVTGLPPENVRKALELLPGRVDLTGKDFGVFRLRMDGSDVEVALPRRERSTGVGHQDFDVQADHTMTPEEDLYRRDFTPNAMAVDLDSGRLIDPYGGVDDIESGQFRTLNPNSLGDDPLRTVRALVMRGRHGFAPDDETREQMRRNAPGLAHLPAERIQAELDKLFRADSPESAIRLARETGVLPYIFPEVDSAFGYDQNNPHHEKELGEHLLSVLHRTAELTPDPDLRLAALLHDVGKPASAWVDPQTGSNHYYEDHYHDHDTGETKVRGQDHEAVGARMAEERLRTLKYPNDRIARVRDLVQHHMYAPFTSKKGARKFLARVGDHADDLFLLREADQNGKGHPANPSQNVDRQRDLVQRVRDAGEPTTQANLAINGNDLINAGLEPGPQMGQVLTQLTNDVIEDPSLNTRDQLLQLARQYGGF